MTKDKSKPKTQTKQHNRRMLTFMRMLRYGVNNFSRNAWLTIAATAVMTITLLIIFTTFAARNILLDTVATLRDKVDMSIYLKTDTTSEEAEAIRAELLKLSSVRKVTYTSPEEVRSQIAQENKNDNEYLEAINEASNKNPGVLRIGVEDINDTTELQQFVEEDELLKEHIDTAREPSFAGERRASIESIGRAVSFAEKVGLIAGGVFVVISSLIIFNTIRMAIFNRKEEIQMMKLIGADRSFIRGPFLVEAVEYGFIAAIIATGLGTLGLYMASGPLESYAITVQPTLHMMMYYAPFVLLAMILIGAVIGIVSSLFATRRYLKI